MKLNIANPATGCQQLIVIEDERKLQSLYDRRISQEIEGELLGDQYAGYIFKITGGMDKQGFPMMQGVLVPNRVRLLLNEKSKCFRAKRTGHRKRKSVRGCIVSHDIAVLNTVIVKKGKGELPGLTDKTVPLRLGPKRASKIRKLFALSKKDDVRKYVIRRTFVRKNKEGEPMKDKKGKDKTVTKAPKIQRLITPLRLQRKRKVLALKKERRAKSKEEAAEWAKLLHQRSKDKRAALISRRRSEKVRRESSKKVVGEKSAAPAPAAAAKPEKKKTSEKAAKAAPAAAAAAPAKSAKAAKGKDQKKKGGK